MTKTMELRRKTKRLLTRRMKKRKIHLTLMSLSMVLIRDFVN